MNPLLRSPYSMLEPEEIPMESWAELAQAMQGGRSPAGARPMAAPAPRQLPKNFYTDSTQSHEQGRTSTNEANWADPQKMINIESAISNLPSVQAQKQMLEQNKKLLAMELNRPMQSDLGERLARIGDWFQGGPRAQAASTILPHEKSSDRMKRIQDWAKSLQDDQRDLSRSVLEGVGKFKSGQTLEQQLVDLLSKRQEGYKPPTGGGSPAVNASRFVKDFSTDETVKKATVGLNAARDLLISAQNPNWLGDTTLKSSLVTAAGLYPVSDRDVKQYGGSPDLASEFIRMIERLNEGKNFTPKDRATIVQYGKIQAAKNQGLIKAMQDQYARGLGAD